MIEADNYSHVTLIRKVPTGLNRLTDFPLEINAHYKISNNNVLQVGYVMLHNVHVGVVS